MYSTDEKFVTLGKRDRVFAFEFAFTRLRRNLQWSVISRCDFNRGSSKRDRVLLKTNRVSRKHNPVHVYYDWLIFPDPTIYIWWMISPRLLVGVTIHPMKLHVVVPSKMKESKHDLVLREFKASRRERRNTFAKEDGKAKKNNTYSLAGFKHQ